MTKEERIQEELTRLTLIFFDSDEDRLSAAAPLLQNCAFMKCELEDLQEVINAEGAVETYQNGEHQSGQKQSATLQAYNMLMKSYSGLMKTLVSLLPNRRQETIYVNPMERKEKEAELRKREQDRQKKIVAAIAQAAEWQKQQREKQASM